MPADHNPEVGFNPFRQHKRSPADALLLAAALVAVVALLLWAGGVV